MKILVIKLKMLHYINIQTNLMDLILASSSLKKDLSKKILGRALNNIISYNFV